LEMIWGINISRKRTSPLSQNRRKKKLLNDINMYIYINLEHWTCPLAWIKQVSLEKSTENYCDCV
jgi:hypothetical protein